MDLFNKQNGGIKRKRYKHSLTKTMTLLILIISVLPLQIFTGIIYSDQINDREEMIVNSLTTSTKTKQDLIQQYFKPIFEIQDMLSEDQNVTGIYSNKYEESKWQILLFDNILNSHNDFSSVYVGLKDGKMYLRPKQDLPDGYDPRTRPWYKTQINNPDEIVITEPYADQSTGDTIITIQKTVRDNETHEIIGVIGIDLKITQLIEMFFSNKIFDDEQNYILSYEGKTLIHNDSSKIGSDVSFMDFFVNQKMSQDDSGVILYKYNGVTKYQFYSKIPDLHWIVYSQIPKSFITHEVNKGIRIFIILFIIISIIQILIGFLFVNKTITRKIKYITNELIKLGEGNLNIKIDLNEDSEFGDLQDNVNLQQKNVKKLIERLKLTITKLMNQSEKIIEILQINEKDNSDLFKKLEGITQEMGDQSSSLEETTQGIEEISSQSQNITESVKGIMEQVEQTVVLQNDGEKQLETIRFTMEQINKLSEENSDQVSDLLQQTKNIGEIVNTINNITEQTNLLQLNQQIEQQRQGDQGRGFQVVADEIRKLQEQSKDSTEEISKILTTIQHSVDLVSDKTQNMVTGIKGTYKDINETTEKFKNITDKIEMISQMSNSQSSQSEEQTQSSEEISQQVDVQNRSVLTILENLNNFKNNIEKQNNDFKGIVEMMNDLEKLSIELDEVSKRFKI